jgi:glutathione S-transferase
MDDPRMSDATLIISSKNYSSWCLRGFLLLKLSGLPFTESVLPSDDAAAREELLLRSSSTRVPCLIHDGLSVWDTTAITEYLNELRPEAGMFPADRAARARCRSISGEMHSGFQALRASLPMNLRVRRPGFAVWSSAQADIDRITSIWNDCISAYGGPFLFGKRMSVGDAMYAPVCTRFVTYDVSLDPVCSAYRDHIMALPDMQEWIAGAHQEVEQLSELEVEF